MPRSRTWPVRSRRSSIAPRCFACSAPTRAQCCRVAAMTATGTSASYRVEPGGEVAGELTVPGDKSISHRALMLGGIAEGVTEISGFLAGEDCLATLRALQDLGVSIERPQPQRVRVSGRGMESLKAAGKPLDMGNAGTAMRLFMGLL